MKTVAIGIAVVCISLVGCGGGAPAAKQPSLASKYRTLINNKPESASVICEDYWSLVDMGWSDNEIFTNLHDGGSFDGFASPRTMFNTVVRWCFDHDK